MTADLSVAELRAAITDADEILLRALSARFKAVDFLKDAKQKEGLPVEDRERESELKKRWKERARELELTEELALLMLDFILTESKRRQST